MRPPHPPTPDFLLWAYRRGYFPMALSRNWDGPLAWFNPDDRGNIPLDAFHLPRRLKDRLRSRRFIITTDCDFPAVIRGCAASRAGEGDTWINDDIVNAYTALHRAGHAHSIEAWLPSVTSDDAPRPALSEPAPHTPAPHTPAPPHGAALVGGIYGVHIGSAFFAESKFSRPSIGGTDASKVCLAHLLLHLRQRSFTLLDTQYWNEHLEQFGCLEIPRPRYLKQLEQALTREAAWQPFDPDANIGALSEYEQADR